MALAFEKLAAVQSRSERGRACSLLGVMSLVDSIIDISRAMVALLVIVFSVSLCW
jgi:hypothetical protein